MGPGLLGAGLSVTAWGAGSVLAKGIDMDAMALGAYRFGLFSILIIGWMQFRGERLTIRAIKVSALGGIALGLNIALFFSAVKLTNVVNATLIGSLQPIVVGFIATRFFGEVINRRDAILSLGAIAGVGMVMLASTGTPEWSAKGDGLAVLAMFSWSTYFIASKRSKDKVTPTEFTAATALWTLAVNLPIALLFDQDLSWPSNKNLGWLMVMIVVAGIMGHAMMNWSLVRIPLWLGSTFTLLIPIVSALIAWAALGEAMVLGQVVAMALVFTSLALVVRGQAQAS